MFVNAGETRMDSEEPEEINVSAETEPTAFLLNMEELERSGESSWHTGRWLPKTTGIGGLNPGLSPETMRNGPVMILECHLFSYRRSL